MIKNKILDKQINDTVLYLMEEYGLSMIHALEKVMCSPYTQELYDGVKAIPECSPEKLGDFYMGKIQYDEL